MPIYKCNHLISAIRDSLATYNYATHYCLLKLCRKLTASLIHSLDFTICNAMHSSNVGIICEIEVKIIKKVNYHPEVINSPLIIMKEEEIVEQWTLYIILLPSGFSLWIFSVDLFYLIEHRRYWASSSLSYI